MYMYAYVQRWESKESVCVRLCYDIVTQVLNTKSEWTKQSVEAEWGEIDESEWERPSREEQNVNSMSFWDMQVTFFGWWQVLDTKKT